MDLWSDMMLQSPLCLGHALLLPALSWFLQIWSSCSSHRRRVAPDLSLTLQERRNKFLGLVESVAELQRACNADDGSVPST